MTISSDIPITVDADILSGTPVFTGTRVPVSALLENLQAGVSLDEFLENFPTVTREQAVRVLEYLRSEVNDLGLSAESNENKPLQFGKYRSSGRRMSNADDFKIAE